MRINNNIMAMNTHRQYTINNSSVAKSTEKLSSGYRINRAGDDAAGLAISEKMRAQIRGLTMASKNSQDAISLVQTAEGALQETHNILQRMRELSVQSASDTNETSIDRDALNKEFQALIAELDDTASKTKFNDMGLIDGTYAANIKTATASSAAFSSVWASSGVNAGTYTVHTRTDMVVGAVSGATATVTANAADALGITFTNGNIPSASITVSFVAGSGGAQTDALNGKWTFSIVDNKLIARNGANGETRSVGMQAVGTGATVTLDLGDLGQITIANSSTTYALNADQIQGMNGSLLVSGGVTAVEAEYKSYASLNGEDVELKDGMTTVVFGKANITIGLANPVDTSVTADIAAWDSEDIVVSKSGNQPFVVQTGANQYDELAISIEKMDAYTLGVKNANIATRLGASSAITQVNTAINLVSTQRAALGALQNRLQHKINNLDTSAENLQSAESRIRDLDMAKEMTTYTKNNILVQASTAMLAQANAAPQGVLQLLQ